jgi:hypothetical protein
MRLFFFQGGMSGSDDSKGPWNPGRAPAAGWHENSARTIRVVRQKFPAPYRFRSSFAKMPASSVSSSDWGRAS